jgi:hypothetical protein
VFRCNNLNAKRNEIPHVKIIRLNDKKNTLQIETCLLVLIGGLIVAIIDDLQQRRNKLGHTVSVEHGFEFALCCTVHDLAHDLLYHDYVGGQKFWCKGTNGMCYCEVFRMIVSVSIFSGAN